MAKISIPLIDTLTLHRELQNLLTEEAISFSIKFDVTLLMDKVTKITKQFGDSRLEIIKKYGNPVPDVPDSFSLEDSSIEDKEKGVKELEALAEKDHAFTVAPLKMVDFKDMKSKYPYRIFYKFVV
jgi:hypothetical protein